MPRDVVLQISGIFYIRIYEVARFLYIQRESGRVVKKKVWCSVVICSGFFIIVTRMKRLIS